MTITGVTGFLGSQTCLLFLKDGGFRVRGTVRSMSNAEKMNPIKKAFGDLFSQLDIVEADLLDEDSLVNAINGSTYVVHTASPYILANITDEENQLIKPAVQGTCGDIGPAQKLAQSIDLSSRLVLQQLAIQKRRTGLRILHSMNHSGQALKLKAYILIAKQRLLQRGQLGITKQSLQTTRSLKL